MTATAVIAARCKGFELGWSQLCWIVICGALVVPPLVAVVSAPIDFDEGYNLQVPAHLATAGTYATDGSAYDGNPVQFDTRITTGPTLLVPIAGLFLIFGQSVWIARLVPTAAYLLLGYLSWQSGRRVAGRRGGVAAAAGVALINPSLMHGGATVLGEITATAFVVAAALQLKARPRAAGWLLGLAILTKLLAILALPCFALALALSFHRDRLSAVALRLTLFLGWVSLPLVAWQVVRLLVLGPTSYMTRAREFVVFFGSHGAGTAHGRDGDFMERVRMLSMVWPPFLLVLGLLLGLLVLLSYRSDARSLLARCAQSHHLALVTALSGTAALWLAWWLLLSDRMWLRHALPAVFIATPLAAAWLARGLSHGRRAAAGLRSLVAVLVAGTLTLETIQSIRSAGGETPSLAQQRHVAQVVRDLGVRNTAHVDWFRNPEIGYLSGVPSRPVGAVGGLLVLSPMQKALEPKRYYGAAAECWRIVYEAGGYTVCWLPSNRR